MLCSAIFAEIKIPPIILFLKVKLCHTSLEYVESFLTLASTDNLTNTGNKKVHCGNSLAIIVLTHIECLDFLGIIDKEYRLLINLFGKISFVLGLQVNTPVYRELKLRAGLKKHVYCLGVSHLCIICISESGKSFKQPLINKAVKEVKLRLAVIHNVINDVLYHIPGKLHIVIKIGKCNLGLDHPELCRVTGGVGILCSKGRTEGINVTECHCISLALKLTRNGKVCALTEEVL